MHTPHDEKIARLFRSLSHPRRVMLFRILLETPDGELSYSRLIAESGLRPSSLSHHLREMTRCGLVASRRKGVNVLFFLTPQALSRATEHVNMLCTPQDAPHRRAA